MMWIPLLIALAFLARYFNKNYPGGGTSPGMRDRWHKTRDPVEILKERYARGEIGKDEYDEKKKDLDQ
ncbi:MAG: SHOCT domain-containing protein [Chlorobiaceae bacterium]|nr:SHOCT domain-containing protein [Chlorobiaceae bacterium]